LREKCGLVGVYSFKHRPVMPLIMNSLRALQHRGQESWGVAAPGYPPYRKLGLVAEYEYDFAQIVRGVISPVGIGHVRYSTVGTSDFRNVQPMDIGGEFFIAHNGTITNSYELEKAIGFDLTAPTWVSDTHIVGLRLLQLLRRTGYDWFRSFEPLSGELVGAYCFLILTGGGDIYAIRDSMGFRPLCIGRHAETDSIVIASESCALSILGAEFERDVQPGEVIKVGGGGVESHIFSKSVVHAHCAFEYTYFAHPSSYLEGINVYSARKRVGRELAKRYRLDGDTVIPVPDSARPAALGFSEESGIPFEEGLLKDRYGKKGRLRSFIQPTVQERVEVNRLVIPLTEAVRGRDVVVVDDSIVRGTSSSLIIKRLRDVGARKISLVSTFPPITHPCYAGIDFPTQEELIAYRVGGEAGGIDEVNRKVAEEVGADFVGYNDIEGLCRGIGLPRNELCLSCVTGDYRCLREMPNIDLKRFKKAQN